MSDGSTLINVTSAMVLPSSTRRVSPMRPIGVSVVAPARGATTAPRMTTMANRPTNQLRTSPPLPFPHDRAPEPARRGCSALISPRADAANLVDPDASEEAGRRVVHRRKLGVRADHRLGEFTKQLGRAAFLDARGAGD